MVINQYNKEFVLKCAYGNRAVAAEHMRKSLRICFEARNRHPIARLRAKSALRLIREFESDVSDTDVVEIPQQVDMFGVSKPS